MNATRVSAMLVVTGKLEAHFLSLWTLSILVQKQQIRTCFDQSTQEVREEHSGPLLAKGFPRELLFLVRGNPQKNHPCLFSVVQSRPFDHLVFPCWQPYSVAPNGDFQVPKQQLSIQTLVVPSHPLRFLDHFSWLVVVFI